MAAGGFRDENGGEVLGVTESTRLAHGGSPQTRTVLSTMLMNPLAIKRHL